MMRFTSQDAYEASVEEHDPIMLSSAQAAKIVSEHGASFVDYVTDTEGQYGVNVPFAGPHDAWHILEWLGY